MGGRGATSRNCKRKAINALVEHMCEEEGVGFIDLWAYFVGKEDMYMKDGLRLSGTSAAVFSENLLRFMDSGTGCNYLNKIRRGVGLKEKPNTGGINKDSTKKQQGPVWKTLLNFVIHVFV